MHLKKTVFLLFIILGFWIKSIGQTDTPTPDTTNQKSYSFVPLPLVYFTPETSWGFGVGAFLAFRFKGQEEAIPSSQLTFGIAYTTEKQFLSYLPFQLFVKEGKVKLYGELGYYRYVYRYYGNGSKSLEEDEEIYSVKFPRVRWNALYQVHPKIFTGLRYFLDDFNITELQPEGILATQDILGKNGGLVSALGVVANYDSRDDIFYPYRGSLIEISYLINSKNVGSDFEYQKIYLDAASYFNFGKNNILALNLYSELTFGDAPFNQLSLLGGPKRMRGYLEGRFRDDHYLAFQSEYRFPIYKRFKGVVFGGLGSVGSQEEGLENLLFSYGLGVRFGISKTERINIRLDYGFGKNTSGFYLTFGEAF